MNKILYAAKEVVFYEGDFDAGAKDSDVLFDFLAVNSWKRLFKFIQSNNCEYEPTRWSVGNGSTLAYAGLAELPLPTVPLCERSLHRLLARDISLAHVDGSSTRFEGDNAIWLEEFFAVQRLFRYLLKLVSVSNGLAPMSTAAELFRHISNDNNGEDDTSSAKSGVTVRHMTLFDCSPVMYFHHAIDNYEQLCPSIFTSEKKTSDSVDYNRPFCPEARKTISTYDRFVYYFGCQTLIYPMTDFGYPSASIESSSNLIASSNIQNGLYYLVMRDTAPYELCDENRLLVVREMTAFLIELLTAACAAPSFFRLGDNGFQEVKNRDIFSRMLSAIAHLAIAKGVGVCKHCDAPIDISKERGTPREFCARKHSSCATDATEERRNEAIKLHLEGLTIAEIAKKLEWNEPKIREWVEHLPQANQKKDPS